MKPSDLITEKIADDLELNYSTNSPTMLVEGITVGGI